LKKKDNIVTPVHAKPKPGTLYEYVADASEVNMSRELLDIISRIEY
jgi:hypothetical protein